MLDCVWFHHRRVLLPLLLFGCVLGASQQPGSSPDRPSLEYEVKAAFLLNFTKFIDWPSDAKLTSGSPFSICILGDDPFGGALNQIVEGESVNGHKLVVQRVHLDQARSCNVVYIARNEKLSLKSLDQGILTVGEGEEFLHQGGVIAFVIDNRHVRFDVNRKAAARAGLTISSKLLNVARAVE